jgi:hypothetical protein
MIATSPKSRTRTSRSSSPVIVAGRAVCARNACLSTSDPSGTQEVLGEDLGEAANVAVLHRMDVIAVQREQRVAVTLAGRQRWHGIRSAAANGARDRRCCRGG